jgi:hypothetical protein
MAQRLKYWRQAVESGLLQEIDRVAESLSMTRGALVHALLVHGLSDLRTGRPIVLIRATNGSPTDSPRSRGGATE